ncbi:MAG: helix-hairpin-helix domain-containing protein [Planctomycetota bacterium]
MPRLVDVNRASIAELATLPGVGRVRARALVLYRVRHGRFRRLADLAAIDGFGSTTLAELAPHLAPLDRRE